MPFTNKYIHMGHTERVRLPAMVIPHVGHMMTELDRLCGTHDEAYVLHILDAICDGLDSHST